MKKKALNKDIRKSFSKSKGRFISIACLIALGSFALVGLQVTGPDMRKTSNDYFKKYNTADLTVIGSMGIDDDNTSAINSLQGIENVEYGYLKDVAIEQTSKSCRIFSLGENISEYEVVSGRLPEKSDEIAFSDASKENYKLGDTITFEEKEDSSGNTVLKNKTFTIVGFIHSSEIISCVNQGQSTAGSGELNSYAVVTEDAFDCDYFMIARMTFQDTKGLDPYSDEYTDIIQNHKSQLEEIMESQPEKRLESIKEEYQSEIDEGHQKISDAKSELSDAKTKLNDADSQIKDAEQKIQDSQTELDSKVNEAQQQIDENQKKLEDSEKQLTDGKTQLASAKAQLDDAQAQITESENQITAGKQTLAEKQAEYNKQQTAFSEKMEEYQQNVDALNSAQQELDTKQTQLESAKSQYESGIVELKAGINQLEQILQNPQISDEEKTQYTAQLDATQTKLQETQDSHNSFLSEQYEPAIEQILVAQQEIDSKNTELNTAKEQLDEAESQLNEAQLQLTASQNQISQAETQLNNAKAQFAVKQNEYNSKAVKINCQVAKINWSRQKKNLKTNVLTESLKSKKQKKLLQKKNKNITKRNLMLILK